MKLVVGGEIFLELSRTTCSSTSGGVLLANDKENDDGEKNNTTDRTTDDGACQLLLRSGGRCVRSGSVLGVGDGREVGADAELLHEILGGVLEDGRGVVDVVTGENDGDVAVGDGDLDLIGGEAGGTLDGGDGGGAVESGGSAEGRGEGAAADVAGSGIDAEGLQRGRGVAEKLIGSDFGVGARDGEKDVVGGLVVELDVVGGDGERVGESTLEVEERLVAGGVDRKINLLGLNGSSSRGGGRGFGGCFNRRFG